MPLFSRWFEKIAATSDGSPRDMQSRGCVQVLLTIEGWSAYLSISISAGSDTLDQVPSQIPFRRGGYGEMRDFCRGRVTKSDVLAKRRKNVELRRRWIECRLRCERNLGHAVFGCLPCLPVDLVVSCFHRCYSVNKLSRLDLSGLQAS